MGNSLEIAELGAPVIREKATIIDDILNHDFQQLIDDMLYTVDQIGGMGIAAPQISKSLRLMLITPRPNPRYPHADECAPIIMINPQIEETSEELESGWEGCLTIPGIRGLVRRHRTITVTFQDRHGKKLTEQYEDFIARVIQHEYDHLEGIVFIDRVQSLKDLMTDKEWRKRISIK